MNLPKTLLSALLTGITLQAVVSCEKEIDTNPKKVQHTNAKEANTPPSLAEPCPACGMG